MKKERGREGLWDEKEGRIEGEWGRNGIMRMWMRRGHRRGNQ